MISAVNSMSSVTATSPPIELAISKGTSSVPAFGEQSLEGGSTIVPLTSTLPVPASGVTVYATSLFVTSSVGPGGKPDSVQLSHADTR